MSWWTRWLTGTLLLGVVAGGFLLFATGTIRTSSGRSLTIVDLLDWAPSRSSPSDDRDAEVPRFEDPRAPSNGRYVAKANDQAYGRYVSRHGRAYFVMASAPGPSHHESGVASFILVRRADGSPPIEPWFWFNGPEDQEARLMEDLVEPGDTVLSRGWMPFGTGIVHVADDGRVVLVNLPGFESAQVLALDTQFRPLWAVPGRRLFPERWPVAWPDWSEGTFGVSSGGIIWHRASWLDDERQIFVVVGWDHEVSGLRLADGAPCASTALEEAVVARLDGPEGHGRATAWRVACQQRWFSAEAAARRTMEDVSARPDSRALAALLLGRMGDPSGRDVLLEVRDQIEEHTHIEFVWEHLDDVLGADAMGDWSARLVSTEETERCSRHGAASGVVRTGAPAIRSLVEALARTAASPHDLDPAESALANWRDGVRLDGALAWTSSSVAWRDFDETAAWAAFAASGASRDLRELLDDHVVASADGHRSRTPLCLPALRRVALHPDPSLAAPLAAFRAAFVAHPDGTTEWQALVRSEADAALAACASAP